VNDPTQVDRTYQWVGGEEPTELPEQLALIARQTIARHLLFCEKCGKPATLVADCHVELLCDECEMGPSCGPGCGWFTRIDSLPDDALAQYLGQGW
jgi:hypothetical protein